MIAQIKCRILQMMSILLSDSLHRLEKKILCSLLIMRSAIELMLPVVLLNFPVGLKKVLITLAKFVTYKI